MSDDFAKMSDDFAKMSDDFAKMSDDFFVELQIKQMSDQNHS
jgi:hypothetical protein